MGEHVGEQAKEKDGRHDRVVATCPSQPPDEGQLDDSDPPGGGKVGWRSAAERNANRPDLRRSDVVVRHSHDAKGHDKYE